MNSGDQAKATAQAMIDQSRRLGLTWQLTAGTMVETDFVLLDGASTPVQVTLLQGPAMIGIRVMCLELPSDGSVYVIGTLGNLPTPGSLVARIRQGTTAQTFTTAVADFIDFDTVDYDPWGGFTPGTPDRYTFQFAGSFMCNGRIVWATNATNRRVALINVNGTTSGTGTIGGASIQAAGTGTTQCGGVGTYIATPGEYVGLRGIQNSGGNLDTGATTDGGPTLEIFYMGQSYA